MKATTPRTITLGSRPSKLARWQTGHILELLQAIRPDAVRPAAARPGLSFQMVTLVTEGDKILDRPLPEIGGKGLFTAELESALRSGQIDLAVHSLKDLPVESAPDLCLGAIGKRADAHDVLISASGLKLAQLPQGARVGTSSLRRQVQLQAARPDLVILPLRGNVDTRLRKALQGDYDAIILAAAGVERLDLEQYVTEYLSFDVMLPAPGQGALAVQCRADDTELREILQAIHDPAADRAVSAERAFLAGLGGGCSAPIAAYAQEKDHVLEITGLVAAAPGAGPDGLQVIRVSASCSFTSSGSEAAAAPAILGKQLAQQALDQGAGELLR